MGPKRNALEVKSGSIEAELIEIKERLGSLETIAGLANSGEVMDHARKHLTSEQRLEIMRLCETLTLPSERVAHRRTGFGLSSGCG
jgi:hypothetical protein